MNSKQQLGQFFTTNFSYVLQNMKIPDKITNIIEPFAGNGDLLNFLENKDLYTLELYDIDPKHDYIIKRDTLNDPPNYNDKFVLTNPPYLARNKSKQKELYDKYNCNDLYKCFITNLIHSRCQGGIIIIPLNFICSIRKNDINLRKRFIEKYSIEVINIFEERVFSDTSYSVCSIYFTDKQHNTNESIKVFIYPSKKIIDISLTEKNNYTIGGEIYNLPYNEEITVERATKYTLKKENITNILVKCIDDNINNQLGFKLVPNSEIFIDNTDKLSARSYATLVINKKITLDEQAILVKKLNEFLKQKREEYNSLFLTNYRESNTIARKRISFDLAFRICNYILSSM